MDTRQAAEAALIELGPDILELLPAADVPTTAEVRERLARIRGQLQTQQARRSLDASRVSLDGEMSLAEALRAIQQQTGNALVGYEDFDQRVTVHFQQTPFWEAVDQLLDQAQLRIDPFAGGGRELKVVRGSASHAPRAACAGLFRFEPTMVTAVRDLRASGPRHDARTPVDYVGATDDAHLPVATTERNRRRRRRGSTGGNQWPTRNAHGFCRERPSVCGAGTSFRAAGPQCAASGLAPRERWTSCCQAGSSEFEFADLEHAENVQQRRAGVTVTLRADARERRHPGNARADCVCASRPTPWNRIEDGSTRTTRTWSTPTATGSPLVVSGS